MLFPAIDVVSAFPLNGITLGNNIHTAVCMGTKYMNNRKVQILFRLIAAIPPIIGATLVRDLAQSKSNNDGTIVAILTNNCFKSCHMWVLLAL